MTDHSPANKRGTVLLAHGSRDPAWGQGIEAVAKALSTPEQPVVCAYIELSQPMLQAAVAVLREENCRHITIIPMFLGLGQHARHDLPHLVTKVKQAWPDTVIELEPALCDRPQFIEAMRWLVQPAAPGN